MNENYVGRHVEEVLREQQSLLLTLNDACQMKNLPSRAELDLRLGDGKNRTVGYTISFVKDDAGNVEGISIFFKDLTLVEQLNEQEKLKDRLAALGQMAAGLAHEIRNPLAAIELTASLIKRKMLDQPTHTAQLESIQSEVRKLNKIVTDCLEFVRPVKVSPERVNLPSLLDESLATVLSTVDRDRHRDREELPRNASRAGRLQPDETGVCQHLGKRFTSPRRARNDQDLMRPLLVLPEKQALCQ